MTAAAIPVDEAARIASLRAYEILDTPPEERFDRLTRMVAGLLDVPISLVSLVDSERQWFKSRIALPATETPRELAFCAHAILDDVPLVVSDATRDARFADNPLVEADPHIRFYAGAPLINGAGLRLGTLCAIDRKPRTLEPEQLEFLTEVAKIVVDEMELSAALRLSTQHATELSQKNRELDAFAHALSHDMRGPVRRIRSFCELLSEPDATAAQRAEYLGFIQAEAETASCLVRDLGRYFEVGHVTEAEPVAVEGALDAALATLSQRIEDAGAVIDVGALPETSTMGGLLTSVFTNLVGNALKYRTDDPPRIEIRSRGVGELDEVRVVDHGVTIPEGRRERAFELLGRVDDRPAIAGSGIGLATCRRIVEGAGGTIRIEATPGGGTTVAFTMPRAGG
ncbi:MAG: ATP-binding protein [Myxococcota bacterium]